MTSKLQEFKSLIDNNGLASADRFEVVIATPPVIGFPSKEKLNMGQISLMSESVSMPSVSMRAREIYNGMQNRNMPHTRGFDDLQIGFNVDSNYDIRDFFEKWMNAISGYTSNIIAYYDLYTTGIEIHALNRKDERKFSIKVEKAYPRTIGGLMYSHDSKSTLKQMVTFSYERYTVIPRVGPPPDNGGQDEQET